MPSLTKWSEPPHLPCNFWKSKSGQLSSGSTGAWVVYSTALTQPVCLNCGAEGAPQLWGLWIGACLHVQGWDQGDPLGLSWWRGQEQSKQCLDRPCGNFGVENRQFSEKMDKEVFKVGIGPKMKGTPVRKGQGEKKPQDAQGWQTINLPKLCQAPERKSWKVLSLWLYTTEMAAGTINLLPFVNL